ncbi:MAG: VanW family protein [Leptospiraceae bacterium]|nr:VanW family protein [Leptospiraceae bacterium]MCP5510914.1 VanW family protein [Leptospiraceae bacterium]
MIWFKKRRDLPGSHRRVLRSGIRLALGGFYFRMKRYALWIWNHKQFARTQITDQELEKEFPFTVFRHSSPIFRKLSGVDPILQKNKMVNLELAIRKMNLIQLEPGKVFSFWVLVGNPTSSKGYLPGVQLRNGNFFAGTGGGLCQLANLIYWMTLHSPLTVKERWRHSFDVFPDSERTLPFGSGATVSYNYVDLMIQNNTQIQFVLKLYLDSTHLYGEWLSDLELPHTYIIYEDYHSFHGEPYGGYTRRNRIRRKVLDKTSGEELRDELITENHAWVLYNPLLSD